MATLAISGARPMRRLVGVALSSIALLAAGSPGAHAFGVRSGGVEHEMVTRFSLQCGYLNRARKDRQPPLCLEPASLDNLAGRRGANGAVQAPDDRLIHLGADRYFWHCDNTDWADEKEYHLSKPYRQTKEEARRKLVQCVDWGRSKMADGGGSWSYPVGTPRWGAAGVAKGLFDDGDRIIASNPGDGLFNSRCRFNGIMSRRAKCNVFEAFGYALNMTQDFYWHTNWTDRRDTDEPMSLKNPAGLREEHPPYVLSLDKAIDNFSQFPAGFTGGCTPRWRCWRRIQLGGSSSAGGLNKDRFSFDSRFGHVTGILSPRGRIENPFTGRTNAQTATTMAIENTEEQWEGLRRMIIARNQRANANQMICALVLDQMEQCNRGTVIEVIDERMRRPWPPRDRRFVAHAASARVASVRPTDAPGVGVADALRHGLPAHARVGVIGFDDRTGQERVRPLTTPDRAAVPRHLGGRANPRLSDPGRPRGTDPTVVGDPPPSPGSASQPSAAPDATKRPAAFAQSTALANADALLDRARTPRGEQGIVLVTARLGDRDALVRRIDALAARGVTVSVALWGHDAMPAAVIAAVERTGGAATATDDRATLRAFATLARGSGLFRIDDPLPEDGTVLTPDAPAALGVTRDGYGVHQLAHLARRAQVHLAAIDRPVPMTVVSDAPYSTRRVLARRGHAASVAVAAGADVQVMVGGPAGRRYAVSVASRSTSGH